MILSSKRRSNRLELARTASAPACRSQRVEIRSSACTRPVRCAHRSGSSPSASLGSLDARRARRSPAACSRCRTDRRRQAGIATFRSRPGPFRSVPSMASTRNDVPRDGERPLEAVRVDEPNADGRAGRDLSRPPSSSAVERRDPFERVREPTRCRRPGGLSRGSMTITPNRPRRTSCEETWWVWYQNVPTWSARKR